MGRVEFKCVLASSPSRRRRTVRFCYPGGTHSKIAVIIVLVVFEAFGVRSSQGNVGAAVLLLCRVADSLVLFMRVFPVLLTVPVVYFGTILVCIVCFSTMYAMSISS